MESVDLDCFFGESKEFNERIYGISKHTKKTAIIKDLILSLYGEVSSLTSAIELCSLPNFSNSNHGNDSLLTSAKQTLLYEGVDIFRYVISILEIAGISVNEFLDAYENKKIYLDKKYVPGRDFNRLEGVVVFDVDDVLNEFRRDFHKYIESKFGLSLVEDGQYYSTSGLKQLGIYPDEIFSLFIEDGQFREVKPRTNFIEAVNKTYANDIGVILLTSRPANNSKVVYDTYNWLKKNSVSYDKLQFTPEKYLWISQQDWYLKNKLLAAVDDAPKHISEYYSHGINVLVPRTTYNRNLEHELLTFCEITENAGKILELLGI